MTERIENQDPVCCLQEIHLTGKDRSERMGNEIQSKWSLKAGVPIFSSGKANSKPKLEGINVSTYLQKE
jgi:hypothetical protein